MRPDILTRKEKNFVLWRPASVTPPSELIIGQLQLGAPISLINEQRFMFQQSKEFKDLWLIAAADCNLGDGEVYYYWFEVNDAHPDRSGARIRITDPIAFGVDWRLCAVRPEGSEYSDEDSYPASIIKFSNGSLIACDASGETGQLNEETFINLPPNKRLVIYELPTAWSQTGVAGERVIGVGTFRDVTTLIEQATEAGNFSGLAITEQGRSYLTELGINALELLPPADSFYAREWGYGTTNFFAPDFELKNILFLF